MIGESDIIFSKNVENSLLYNQIMGLIVRDSIATMPNEVLKVIGFELLEVIATYLIRMRKNGLQILEIESLEPLKYKEFKKLNYSDFDKINFDSNNYLVFGDLKNQNKGMFILNNKQKELINCYDDVLNNMVQVNKATSLWYMQIKDFSDKIRNPLEKKSLAEKVKSLLNRGNQNLTILDSEDNIKLLEATNSNIMINEIKETISTVFTIPYSKIFKGSSSGFNNLDKNDLENWNFEIRFFQGAYIMPLIKKIYEIKGLKLDFENLSLEPILYENKQIEEDLKTQKIENIIKLRSMNLINMEEAKTIINSIYMLKI